VHRPQGWLERWSAREAIDLRTDVDGWSARLSERLDEHTQAFEDELLRAGIELPLCQRHGWLRASPLEHRLFQLRDPGGAAAMQIALLIERPRRLPLLGRARAWKLGAGTSTEAEWLAVRALRELCAQAGDLVSLRLQPYRRDLTTLRDFEGRARRSGYQLCEPLGVTRTLIVDLSAPPEVALAALSKKTRAKVRHHGRAQVELRPLTDAALIPACVTAVNASLARTGGGTTHYDFTAAFALAAADPGACRAIGLFGLEQPDQLAAFVIGFRHGELAEYGVAGSLMLPWLRALPFNYWLVWELMLWARQGGARWLDLGGITDGGPGDARAGISDFKRHFPAADAEVGRELLVELQPARALALSLWQQLQQAPAPRRRS
jgi:hypothetical protein